MESLTQILDSAPDLDGYFETRATETDDAAPEYGSLLSPSQACMYIECAASWAFRKIWKVDEPPTVASAIGKTCHSALGANFAQKIESSADLPAPEVVEIARAQWKEESAEVSFTPKHDAAELGQRVETLVERYMYDIAPLVDPVAVELRVAGKIGRVDVRGDVDYLDRWGAVGDYKSICQKPGAIRQRDRIQVTTYAQLTEGASGTAHIDYLVKTKARPSVHRMTTTVTDADIAFVNHIYPMAQEGMRSGNYPPNRMAKSCNRLMCGYADVCEEQFGGRVPLYPEGA
jgi:PD-(D/E)XK nuclease superfamily protein